MPEPATGRTEMVGRPPQSGRIVVKDEDVAAFEGVGWVAIEPTTLPLSGLNVPGKKQPTEAELLKANAAALLAKVMKANTPQLKVLLEKNGADVHLDALATVSERREAVAVALGLIEKPESRPEESKPDPLAGKSTEEIRSELEQARLADEAAEEVAGEEGGALFTESDEGEGDGEGDPADPE